MVRKAVDKKTHETSVEGQEKGKKRRCSVITVRPDFTRKRGQDVDERRYAGSTDASQLHVVVEGPSHFIIKQLRPTIEDLHLADTSQRK